MYGDRTACGAYHTARGVTTWTGADADLDAALQRGSDYINRLFWWRRKSGAWVSMFKGTPVTEPQDDQFPRDGIVMENGTELGDNVTPTAIEHAAYEAALLELVTPGSLSPNLTPNAVLGAVVQRTVGPITIKYDGVSHEMPGYEQRPPNMPIVFAVERLVAPYLKSVALCDPAVRVV